MLMNERMMLMCCRPGVASRNEGLAEKRSLALPGMSLQSDIKTQKSRIKKVK